MDSIRLVRSAKDLSGFKHNNKCVHCNVLPTSLKWFLTLCQLPMAPWFRIRCLHSCGIQIYHSTSLRGWAEDAQFWPWLKPCWSWALPVLRRHCSSLAVQMALALEFHHDTKSNPSGFTSLSGQNSGTLFALFVTGTNVANMQKLVLFSKTHSYPQNWTNTMVVQ